MEIDGDSIRSRLAISRIRAGRLRHMDRKNYHFATLGIGMSGCPNLDKGGNARFFGKSLRTRTPPRCALSAIGAIRPPMGRFRRRGGSPRVPSPPHTTHPPPHPHPPSTIQTLSPLSRFGSRTTQFPRRPIGNFTDAYGQSARPMRRQDSAALRRIEF